ncbi:MAG: putative RNase H-like nuclease [Thermoproteota archaeon]
MAVAGIDRWRGGWIIAELDDTELTLWATSEIESACERLAQHDAVAIDMPIALATHGRREAEALVRAALGSSARSVFTSPTRVAALADSQSEATEINRANGGPGISAQAFGLFASIRELRTALAGPRFEHWWETHPETTFAIMNDGVPMASKKSAIGVGQRLVQLRRHVPFVDDVLLTAPGKIPVDDVLDAIAAAWSARRIAAGAATIFGPPGRDDEGFAFGIRV